MFRGDAEGEPSQSTEIVAEVVKEMTPTVSGKPAGAADSLLPIVQSQRERYRLRVQELEVQCMAQIQQQQLQQNELDKLRSDNVKLYEKIKFLQSYPTGKSRQNDAESRYAMDYEERLDPFQTFSKKERMRKYTNLKVHDKITLSMGRFIMGSKLGRTIAFFYTIFLHLLVFLVLYKVAYTESCRRDMAIDYHQKFAEHMHEVHGDNSFDVKP